MPIVHEDMDLPGGAAPLAEVTIQLAGEGCRPFHGTTPPNVHILGGAVLRPGDGIDETGYWEIDLVGNGDIAPSGTAYRVTRRLDDRRTLIETCIEVPVSGGPYVVTSLETDPPGDIATGGGVSSSYVTAYVTDYVNGREQLLDDQALARQALAQFRAEFARARSGTADDINSRSVTLVMVGDSLTEAFTPTVRGLMWPRHVSRILNGARMGGMQYLPAAANFGSTQTAADWPGGQPVWTYSAAPTGDTTHGGDLHAVTMGAGSTATLTFFGETVIVMYTRTPGGPVAAAVTLDGVSQTAIAAQGAEAAGQVAVFVADGYGFHTLTITSTAGQLLLEGAAVSDNEPYVFGIPTRVIRTPHFGHAGFDSDLFVERTNWATSVINLTTNLATGTYPSLFVIWLGANDQVLGKPPAELQSNLVTLMGMLDSRIDTIGITTNPGFLLLAGWSMTQAYVDALWGARDDYGEDRVGVLDMRRYLPGEGASLGVFDASGHPNDAGQLWLARTVSDFILGPLAPTFPPEPAPGYTNDDILIEAATPADFRLNWTETLAFTSVTSGQQYDQAAGASDVKERRHRVWFQRGTYEVRLRYGEVTTTGGQGQVVIGGTTVGSVTTTGTTNNVAESVLGSIVIDSPGPRPVVIRKTALNAGAFRFNRLWLRKTA